VSRTRSSGCKSWHLLSVWFFRNFIWRSKLIFYLFIIHFSVHLSLMPSCCTRSVAGWIASIWQVGSTQRQVRKLISWPGPTARTRHLSFNRTQFRVVVCLITGHNTLTRHLHVMWLTNSPLCRRCGAADETSEQIFCECEALASLRHVHFGSFSLDPEDIKSLIWGPHGTLAKEQGPPEQISDYGAPMTHFLGLGASGP